MGEEMIFTLFLRVERGTSMSLVVHHPYLKVSRSLIKQVAVSVAVVSTLVITGCATKPQVNNPVRYSQAPEYYTVRSGDTLSLIGARYGLSYLSIADMNGISSPYVIYVGQSLRLKKSGSRSSTASTQPMVQTAPIQRQTVTLPTTSSTTKSPTVVSSTTPAISTKLTWMKPSNGNILQRFNVANNVKGIRFGGQQGDPVMAAASGQVVYAADGLKEYGNLVLIKHIDGYITAYAHNSRIVVNSGDNVSVGQKIAEMGSSGTNRVMLEFQVRLDGKPIDPAQVLPIN